MDIDNAVIIWNRVWVWGFIILGVVAFWSGIIMTVWGSGTWETLITWSLMFPLFSTGMVWYLISTDEK